MATLGGSIWVHNAIEFDYCIVPAVRSLAALCDTVVVGDAESDDGTTSVLEHLAAELPNIDLVTKLDWNCRHNFERISVLANEVRKRLQTDWHFMLQADEVIHEASFDAIRRAIDCSDSSAYSVRRLNLFGSLERMVGLDIPMAKKPCSDAVIRLARTDIPSWSDGESLRATSASNRYVDEITIFHYGFVRDIDRLIHKSKTMQGWFFGPNTQYDSKLDRALKEDGTFDHTLWFQDHELDAIPMPHPKFAEQWVAERRSQWTE